MPNESNPFELEPEDDRPEREPPEDQPKPSAPKKDGSEFELEDAREIEPRVVSRTPPPVRRDPEDTTKRPAPVESDPHEDGDVDTRTVKERQGKQRKATVGPVPPPDDWPGESVQFPLRKPGPALIGAGAVVYVMLDALGYVDGLLFFTWPLKVFVGFFFLCAQLAVISKVADGDDTPEAWKQGLPLETRDARSSIQEYASLMVRAVALFVPALVLMQFDGAWFVGVVLLIVATAYVPVMALGTALGDHTLKWPWNALPWVFKAPLACLGGAVGWWVVGITEVVLLTVRPEGFFLLLVAAIVLRVVCFYALLWSARVLGVLGRSWTA